MQREASRVEPHPLGVAWAILRQLHGRLLLSARCLRAFTGTVVGRLFSGRPRHACAAGCPCAPSSCCFACAELGVDFGHIRQKVMIVLNPRKPVEETVLEDTDLAGPLVFACILGLCSMLV